MNAEVIIVGGGIIGCAAAYNLAKMAFLSLCWRAAKISATAAPPATAAVFASPDVIPENCRW